MLSDCRFYWLIGVLLPYALPLIAQNDKAVEVYPVRVNHKVGFIKFYPEEDTVYLDTLILPRYDYIAEERLPWNTMGKEGEPSPFRLYELDQRVGLLDSYLQEVLPNRYKRIRPLTAQFLALEEDALFQLFSRDGRSYFDGDRYHDICPDGIDESTGQMRFFVKQGMYWGLRRADGKELFAPRFLRVLPTTTPGFYKVRLESGTLEGWKVADKGGRVLNLPPAQDVVVLNRSVVALKDEKARWTVYRNRSGVWEPIKGPLRQIDRLDKRCAVMHRLQPEGIVLWDFEQNKELWAKPAVPQTEANKPARKFQFTERPYPYYPWVYPLGEGQYVLCEEGTATGFKERLIDAKGEGRSMAYSCILPTAQEGVYKVNQSGYWGLISPQYWGEDLVPCQYFDIGPFENNVTIVLSKHGEGALFIRKGQLDSIPAVHDAIERSGGDYLAKLGETVVIYKLSEEGAFTETALFDGLSMVAQNTSRMKEAAAKAKERPPAYFPARVDFGKLAAEKRDGELHLVKTKRQNGRVKEIWRDTLPLSDWPAQLRQTVADSVFYYYENSRIRPSSSGIADGLAGQVKPIRFYHLGKRQPIPTPEIIGLRPFDSAYAYTAFLTPDGQMGLIDRYGNQCRQNGQPLRYTYIGPFEAGRARVCVDAQWHFTGQQEKPPQPYKFSLGSPPALRGSLRVRRAQGVKLPYLGNMFLTDQPGRERHWGYIDAQGRWLMKVEAGYIENYHWQDSTAIIACANGERDAYGHPDASQGLLDYQGNRMLPCRYKRISRLQSYYLLTVGNTPTFFFTQLGHEIFVNPTRPRPFSEGMAQFRAANGKWGYVNQAGEVIIPPQFSKCRPFSDGLALVADSSGQCSYIDRQGQIAFRTSFTARQWLGLGDFHQGRAWFKEKGWSWGLFDREGKALDAPKPMLNLSDVERPAEEAPYPLPMDFQHGLAVVQFLTAEGQPYAAALDTSGRVVFEDKGIHRLLPFCPQGVTKYQTEPDGYYGLIGADGKRLCPPLYQQIGAFSEGLAAVQAKDGRWGYLGRDGKLALPAIYQKAQAFSEGLAAVKRRPGLGWQYIDRQGEVALPGPFEQASGFEEGVALVRHEQRRMVIDQAGLPMEFSEGEPAFFSEGILGIELPGGKRQGDALVPGYYADASGNNIFGQAYAGMGPFTLGVAKVRPLSENKLNQRPLGAINRRGVMVVPPKYRMLHIQPDGNIIINPQRFFGLANKNGEVLLPPQFDRINLMKEGNLCKVERGEKIGYYLLEEGRAREAWPLQH